MLPANQAQYKNIIAQRAVDIDKYNIIELYGWNVIAYSDVWFTLMGLVTIKLTSQHSPLSTFYFVSATSTRRCVYVGENRKR